MKIFFLPLAYQKIRIFIDSTPHEISGLGKIKKIGRTIFVEDVQIFKQTVSPVETVLDRRSLGRFYDDIIKRGEDLSEWKLWWHSHADMDVFFSKTDVETIEDFDNDTEKDNWMLSIVLNKRGDVLCRIDSFSPIRYVYEGIEWDICFPDNGLRSNILNEIVDKVRVKNNSHINRVIFPAPKNKDARFINLIKRHKL